MTGLLIFGAILSGRTAMAKKIDKEALANKIKALAGLDAEERSELLGLLSERKKYGLVWEEKPEDVEEVMREQLPVLAEVKERAIVASAPSAPPVRGGAQAANFNLLLPGLYHTQGGKRHKTSRGRGMQEKCSIFFHTIRVPDRAETGFNDQKGAPVCTNH